MKKIVKLTEQDLIKIIKRVILEEKKLDLINEQVEGVDKLTISGRTFFDDGKYSENSLIQGIGYNDLVNEIGKATNFLINNKDTQIFVKIVASESQVTNKDKEVNPPYPELPKKELSRLRAETMKAYLTNIFNSLISRGAISKMPIFEPSELLVGETPYERGVTNLRDPELRKKYESERFVKVELKIQSAHKCIVGLTVEVYYDKNNVCGENHCCDEAVFDVFFNEYLLNRVNLNNKTEGGQPCGNRSSGKIIIDNEMAKKIIGDTSRDIEVYTQAVRINNDAHSSAPRIKIMRGEDIIFDGCTQYYSERKDFSKKLILKLNNCGNWLWGGTSGQIKQENSEPIKIDKTFKLEDGYYSIMNGEPIKVQNLQYFAKKLRDTSFATDLGNNTFKANENLTINFWGLGQTPNDSKEILNIDKDKYFTFSR